MAKKQVKTKRKSAFITPKVEIKQISQTRKDIASWQRAIRMTNLQDNPKYWYLQQLFDNISLDALFTSQYKNRELKTLSEPPVLRKPNGEIDEKQTEMLQNAQWVYELNRAIFESRFRGYSLIELSFDADDNLQISFVPRTNIDPKGGFVYPDYTDDKKINYRKLPEYGTWILEFIDKSEPYGLMNKLVPHVLFKRFAQSSYSELCEIYGIPPRVLKTDVADPEALNRGKEMMENMGRAAWLIIDENEEFNFAAGVATNGDVYTNLVNLCNNEISMLVSGAIIGQDTKHGNRSKEESSQEILQELINSDWQFIKQQWKAVIIPALRRIGVISGDVQYDYQAKENLDELWAMTTQALPYYDVDPQWIKDKFGIEVQAKRNQAGQPLSADDFFD